MRLIDADALERHSAEDCGASADVVFVTDIEKAPTIEAEPVKHSQWKYYHKQGKAVCMACSFERNLDDNFGRAVACPNCSARMDGDSNG